VRGKRRLPIRSGFLNSICVWRGGGGERREKKIASDERNSIREILFMKQRKQERVNERERERERESFDRKRAVERVSHLERVHALPVLVQVVHEIHIFLLLTT